MATSFKQVADNAISTTNTSLSSIGVTSITAAANVFPTPGNGFTMTIWNGSDPTLDANMEKVTVSANSSGVLTTSATTKTHTSPAYIAILDVAGNITDLQTAVNAAENTLALATTKSSVTVASGAATVPATSRTVNVTNNAASAAAITLSTSGAVDGQYLVVRFYDFSGVAQTITWVNTSNSQITVPTTSNGSTTAPLTVGFQFNGATSLWRCIAVA